jgi:hypothetical protein
MAQITQKGDKYPFNTSKSDYKVNAPVASSDEPKSTTRETEAKGVGRGPKDRKKSPY